MAGNARSHGKLKTRVSLDLGEITERLRDGRFQIHKFLHGFIITEIKDLKTERILHVFWLGGSRFDEWMEEAFATLRTFAKKHDCKAIEARCRPGLAMKLRELGFREIKREVRVEI